MDSHTTDSTHVYSDRFRVQHTVAMLFFLGAFIPVFQQLAKRTTADERKAQQEVSTSKMDKDSGSL